VVAVVVQVLHLLLFDVGLAEGLPGLEGRLNDATVQEALELGPGEGVALPGLDVLEVDDDVRLTFVFDLQASAEVRYLVHDTYLLKRSGETALRARADV